MPPLALSGDVDVIKPVMYWYDPRLEKGRRDR
jgi:hypothetical protein